MTSIKIPKRIIPASLLVLLALVLIARIVYVASRIDVSATLKFLPFQYNTRADGLLAGNPTTFAEAWGLFYVPLALFYGCADLLGLHAVRVELFLVAQGIMGSLAVVGCYFLSRRIMGTTVSLLVSLIAAVYYPLIYTHTLILSESLFALILIGSLLLLLRPSHTIASSSVLGCLIALLFITRPIFLGSIPVLLLWTYAYHRETIRRHWRKTVAGLVSMSVMLLIACALNALNSTHHRFTLAGNGGVNIAMTQCQLQKLEYKMPDGSESFWFSPPVYQGSQHESITTAISFSDQLYYLKMGMDCLVAHPERLLGNFQNIWRIYDSTFYPDLGSPSYHHVLLAFWRWIAIAATILFFLFPFVWVAAERPTYLLIGGLILSLYAAMYIGNPGEERYLVPYFLLLLPYAALTIKRAIRRLRHWLSTIIKVEELSG